MPMEPVSQDDPIVLEPLANWCKQSVLFAFMVRARDLSKPILDNFANDALAYAEEVYQKVLAQAGPTEHFENTQTWMTAIVGEMFRWIQDHLER